MSQIYNINVIFTVIANLRKYQRKQRTITWQNGYGKSVKSGQN